MDPSTEAVCAFLVSMEPIREAFGEFVRHLYKQPAVKRVQIYNPTAYPSSDFGVSATLHSGAMVDFWIELNLANASWQLEYSIERHDPDEDGSHTEIRFPEETIYSAADLPGALLSAIARLLRASENSDLYR